LWHCEPPSKVQSFFLFSFPFSLLINSETVRGHRFAFASGVLHRDISSGNILFTDQLNCSGFLHDPDYSEVVLMPEDKVEEDSVQQISRRLKDMMVSGIYCISDAVKQFLTRALINSWRLMC
jgi:Fungal protein kinase